MFGHRYQSKLGDPVGLFLVHLAAVALLSMLGCDIVQDATDWATETHRQKAKGRAGVLRALEVVEVATLVAAKIRDRGDGTCREIPAGPLRAEVTIDAELIETSSDLPISTFSESRTVIRDTEGNVSVLYGVSFLDPSRRSATAKREERCTEGWHYVKEGNMPFVRHRAHLGDGEKLLRRALDPVGALIALGGDGWSPSKDGGLVAEANHGGKRVQCAQDPDQRGWLTRLAAVSSLSYAEAHLATGADRSPPLHSTLSVRLVTSDESAEKVVRIDVDESIKVGAGAPVTPPEGVFDTRRDRPYRDIQTILGDRLGLPEWQRKKLGE